MVSGQSAKPEEAKQDAVQPKVNLAALLGKANGKLSAQRHVRMSNKSRWLRDWQISFDG